MLCFFDFDYEESFFIFFNIMCLVPEWSRLSPVSFAALVRDILPGKIKFSVCPDFLDVKNFRYNIFMSCINPVNCEAYYWARSKQ